MYGQYEPPIIDSKLAGLAGIPISMYVAKYDGIIYPDDSRWLRD